jgi:DNA-binding NtrC family response regulator
VRKTDVRLIAATNADIAAEVAAGRFREDLLYRMNTVEVRLPPLRDRREDIPKLAALFLGRQRRGARTVKGFAADAMEALLAHPWPGNIRELEHVVERAILLAAGELVTAEDLALRGRGEAGRKLEDMTLDEVERYLIERALAQHGGNVSEAARALGLSRSALYRRLQSLGVRGGG